MRRETRVDLLEASRREKRQTFTTAIILALVVFLIGAPVVEAAVTRIRGNVNIKDTGGGKIDASAVPDLGLLGAPGSSGALAVRNFGGGGGLLGAGDCDPGTAGRPATVTVDAGQNTIITAIIVTGSDARVGVSAPDLDTLIGPGDVVEFTVNAANPNVFVGLGNGLTVFPSELVFTCNGTDGQFVVLGQ
jgi:hypothetical protein